MRDSDLPLFAWQPPCKVIVFPLINRIGKVRHTAQTLARKQGDDATSYWKQVVASNRKHLARIGMDDEAIDFELRTFFNAVQSEMVRMTYSRRSGGDTPGGAA